MPIPWATIAARGAAQPDKKMAYDGPFFLVAAAAQRYFVGDGVGAVIGMMVMRSCE